MNNYNNFLNYRNGILLPLNDKNDPSQINFLIKDSAENIDRNINIGDNLSIKFIFNQIIYSINKEINVPVFLLVISINELKYNTYFINIIEEQKNELNNFINTLTLKLIYLRDNGSFYEYQISKDRYIIQNMLNIEDFTSENINQNHIQFILNDLEQYDGNMAFELINYTLENNKNVMFLFDMDYDDNK